MDRLDQLIAAKQTEIDQFKKIIDSTAAKHDRALIELEALRAAAAARPAAKHTGQVARAPHPVVARRPRPRARLARGGRQAGDISHEWRGVLGAAARAGARHSYGSFYDLAVASGINTKMPNVRERVRRMAETGLLEGSPEEGYAVTKAAIERFNLGAGQEAT
jgi:hypothetical protein